jgi:hypothetical protein
MGNESRFTPFEDYLQTLQCPDWTESDWAYLRFCKTVADCDEYLRRFRESGFQKLIPVIKKIKRRFNAEAIGFESELDGHCLMCLLEYEDVRREIKGKNYTATRLRRSGDSNGWFTMLERTILQKRKGESIGFTVLMQGNRLDASFEAFVVKNKTRFSEKVVTASVERLTRYGYPIAA